MLGKPAVEDPGVVPADVRTDMPRIERGGGERAEAGERHLAERQLAAPAGEHDDRDRAQREREDRSVRLVARRLVGRAAAARSRPSSASPATSCGIRLTHQISRSRSGTAATRGANWKLSPPTACRAAHPRDEHQHREEQHELHEPGLGRVVEEEHPVEDADRRSPPSTARGNDTMPPMSAAAMPRSSVSGPMCTRSADAWSVAVRRIATVREEAGDRPDAGRHQLRVDAGHAGRGRRSVAAARTASPNAVWPSSHHSPTVMTGTTISTSSWLAETSMSRPGCHVPLNGSGNCVCSEPVRYVGQRERDRLAQLRDADRRDEHDHARRLEQPADHRQLDHRAGERADDERDDQRRPVRPAVHADHHREQRGGRHADVADREVDDPARPVDEHDAHRDERDDQPADDALEHQVPGDDGRRASSAALGPEEHRPGEVVAFEQPLRSAPRTAPRPSRGRSRGRRSRARR